jgi:hypothetical protein
MGIKQLSFTNRFFLFSLSVCFFSAQSFGSQLDPDIQKPTNLFIAAAKNPQSEEAWKEIYQYRYALDGKSSLLYKWACFDAILDNPTLFQDRFINGDGNALLLMFDALRSDGSARGNLHKAVTSQGYKDFPDFIKALFTKLEKNTKLGMNSYQTRRAIEFYIESLNFYKSLTITSEKFPSR